MSFAEGSFPLRPMSCCWLPRNKAPGSDYISNEIVTALAKARPSMLLDLYNECLETGRFPRRWKVARLVLLFKSKEKPPEEPSSYRPLSLLDGVGKLFASWTG